MLRLEHYENPITRIEVEMGANAHSHLRISELAPHFARLNKQGGFDSLLWMPNVAGHDDPEQAYAYSHLLARAVPEMNFVPTFRLTQDTTVRTIDRAADLGFKHTKGYSKLRTTGSEDGIRYFYRKLPEIKRCGERGIAVHFHPVHPWKVFTDKEAEYQFINIVEMCLNETDAVIFWEHGSDARCIPAWEKFAETGRFYVTLTAHHLASNTDDVYGDVRGVCQPPIRDDWHRRAFLNFVAKNYPWVLAGLDDAPHPRNKKRVDHGRCACGDFTSAFGMQLYAHGLDPVIQAPGGVETFINFTSRNPRAALGLPPASGKFILERKPWLIPAVYNVLDWEVEPFWAQETIGWSIQE